MDLLLTDYMDAYVAYLMGLIIARGTLHEAHGIRQITIEFPFSTLHVKGLTESYDLPTTLETSQHDFVRDFFTPLLACATTYDRAVGFFSSGWLRINATGMLAFAAHHARARIIASPILAAADWQALHTGSEARRDAVLRESLQRDLDELRRSLAHDTLSALAWMVADDILDFRLAVPANALTGEFHAKFGIFTDRVGNRISFAGSYNDSVQGTRNYESLKIFAEWKAGHTEIVAADVRRFERLWCDDDSNVQVYPLPEAAREAILTLRDGTERPYPAPPYSDYRPRRPATLHLRDYQEEAIAAWFAHECKGILEMATGTGKTITALAAAVRLFGRERSLAVIISVPYQHLVDQWRDEALAFGFQPLLAYKSKRRWYTDLVQRVAEYNHGDRIALAVITTHTTFSDSDFQRAIGYITRPALLIADEMHHLGAARRRQHLPEQMTYRLGLSATPDRWFDDEGTDHLRTYFGETVFAYTLEQAIGTVLTSYVYHPAFFELTDDEFAKYQDLSTKIARLAASDRENRRAAMEMLLIKRARLLNAAENKLPERVAGWHTQSATRSVLLCPEQINAVTRLLGWEHNLLVHRFTAEEPNNERQRLLAEFASGQLQGLVAMKCFDEGVDVPATRTAFILASSSNPREFIQRRGRILRRASGKDKAVIYDLIAVPPRNRDGTGTANAERSIIQHELHRFREFASSARNKHQALDVIWDLARRYGINGV